MFKVLLAWRYLRTRFIALASIVSVTLGVMTLIVVNSVMSGFSNEMKSKLHGLLSDIELVAPGMGEMDKVAQKEQRIRDVLGDDLQAITTVVRVPAMINFNVNGRPRYQQVMLFGIDDTTYSTVSDFRPYLLNDQHLTKSPFSLLEDGYDASLPVSGWAYRRAIERDRKSYREILKQTNQNYQDRVDASGMARQQVAANQKEKDQKSVDSVHLPKLPNSAPKMEDILAQNSESTGPSLAEPSLFGSSAKFRGEDHFEPLDPEHEQRVGIVLGIGIGKIRAVDPDTRESIDHFFLRPGDDIELTVPSAGSNPQPVLENCTVTDFYQCNMSQYDSGFAFMPLSHLQRIRGMIDPVTGQATISSLQMKLRPGADLEDVRRRLRIAFPTNQYPLIIQTWKDSQAMIISAIDLEITIMNVLLFLIIAVAGFGILATFYMIVVEKTKDIGVLKSLGASSTGIASIFLGYGLSLGIVGAGVGTLSGLLFVWNINHVADFFSYMAGRELVDPSVYFFSEIPTLTSPAMVIGVSLGAIAVAILASVLPAMRAATMNAVDSLRFE